MKMSPDTAFAVPAVRDPTAREPMRHGVHVNKRAAMAAPTTMNTCGKGRDVAAATGSDDENLML
jgi:hypothetical protein